MSRAHSSSSAEAAAAATAAPVSPVSAPADAAGSAMESDAVFEQAADLFRVMSTPMRLKIISGLCNGERSVTDLLLAVPTTQPNMSQHLATLLQAGVVARRRDGVRMLYRIANDRVVTLCRAVCTQIAIESDWADVATDSPQTAHPAAQAPTPPSQRKRLAER